MHRPCFSDGAFAMAWPCLSTGAFAELDIVSSLERTGDSTFGDHTSAMHLLQSGVPFNVIALWLGHRSTTTAHRYVEADLGMKEKALARLEVPDPKVGGGVRTFV